MSWYVRQKEIEYSFTFEISIIDLSIGNYSS